MSGEGCYGNKKEAAEEMARANSIKSINDFLS